MDNTHSLYGQIVEIIRKETRFLRHYWGEVASNTDIKKKGRILVKIPALGWDTQDKAAWCQSRDKKSMIVPDVGDYVEVYFLEGDPSKAVYLGTAHELDGGTPDGYNGPTDRVIYKDAKTSITVNKTTGEIRVKGFTVVLESGDGSTWLPNVLPNCLFTGAPHGGTLGGIVKLKGA